MSIINVYLIFFKSSYFNRNQLKNTGYFYKLKQFFKNKIKVSRVRWRRVTMASANWNQETKSRLNEKISGNMNDLGSLARQIVRGSHSSDLLAQAAKNFAFQENTINNSLDTLKKMDMIKSQLEFQLAAVERSTITLDDIQDQLKTIQR